MRGTRYLLALGVLGLMLSGSGCTEPLPPTAPPSSASQVGTGPVGDTYAARQQRSLLACLREAGWNVRYDAENKAIQAEVPPEQSSAYREALNACIATFEEDNPPKQLTMADYRELYRQELAAMKCLESIGYPPIAQPISEQRYVEAYRSGQAPPWTAYSAVGDVSGSTLAQIEEKCPQPSVDE